VPRKQYREIMGLDDAPGPGGDDHPVSSAIHLRVPEGRPRIAQGFNPACETENRGRNREPPKHRV